MDYFPLPDVIGNQRAVMMQAYTVSFHLCSVSLRQKKIFQRLKPKQFTDNTSRPLHQHQLPVAKR